MRSTGRAGAWAASLLLALFACQRASVDPEEYAARTAVVRYNEALVQAFRAQSTEPLRDVATPEELERIGALLVKLAEHRKVMVARQTSQRVLQVTLNKKERGVTLVDAVETWEYEHRDASDPRKPAPVKREEYRIAYQLIRPAGRYLVWEIVQHELPPEQAQPPR